MEVAGGSIAFWIWEFRFYLQLKINRGKGTLSSGKGVGNIVQLVGLFCNNV